jgi:hypothetical protein
LDEACKPADVAASPVTIFLIHIAAAYVVDVWEFDLTMMLDASM